MNYDIVASLKNCLAKARSEAFDRHFKFVEVEHMISNMLDRPNSFLAQALVSLGILREDISDEIDRYLSLTEKASSMIEAKEIRLSARTEEVFDLAWKESKQETILAEHFFLALIRHENNALAKILQNKRLHFDIIERSVQLVKKSLYDNPNDIKLTDIETLTDREFGDALLQGKCEFCGEPAACIGTGGSLDLIYQAARILPPTTKYHMTCLRCNNVKSLVLSKKKQSIFNRLSSGTDLERLNEAQTLTLETKTEILQIIRK